MWDLGVRIGNRPCSILYQVQISNPSMLGLEQVIRNLLVGLWNNTGVSNVCAIAEAQKRQCFQNLPRKYL